MSRDPTCAGERQSMSAGGPAGAAGAARHSRALRNPAELGRGCVPGGTDGRTDGGTGVRRTDGGTGVGRTDGRGWEGRRDGGGKVARPRRSAAPLAQREGRRAASRGCRAARSRRRGSSLRRIGGRPTAAPQAGPGDRLRPPGSSLRSKRRCAAAPVSIRLRASCGAVVGARVGGAGWGVAVGGWLGRRASCGGCGSGVALGFWLAFRERQKGRASQRQPRGLRGFRV